MQFLGDLDGLTIFMIVAAVVLAVAALAMLRVAFEGKWQPEGNTVLALLMFAAIFSFIHAYKAYCPDADQPHIRLTGPLSPYKIYRYSVGRRSYRLGMLECVDPCNTTVPLLEFNREAVQLIVGREPSARYTVTYLGRKENANLQNGYSITAHPVVEIQDPSGDRIFYIDTTRHWPRTITLLAGGSMCIATVVLCLMSWKPNTDDEEFPRRPIPDDVPAELHVADLRADGEDRNES